ncbi:DUF1931 family protein [Rhodococcus sp. A14]|uniref:DUF1931 family protein n=1 Tax=Rhodococcus sp. A14 TaxID=1194106 RepID=UPI00142002A0|nr:DUF1931 family protein [Rhodococcus sp. A14]
MTVMTVSQFHSLCRLAAHLEVDGNDLPRFSDLVTRVLFHLLLAAQASAAAHGRYTIEPADLPITTGLQASIRRYRTLDIPLDLDRILDQLAAHRPLDRILATDTLARVPDLVGGLTVTLARTFAAAYPGRIHPHATDWEAIGAVANLYL